MNKEEVIILHPELGKVFEKAYYKKGYIYNYLIPNNLVLLANERNELKVKKLKAAEEKRKALIEAEAEKLHQEIKNVNLEFELTKDKEGKLFGSINQKEILEKLKELGFEIKKEQFVNFTPLNKSGENVVKLKLSNKITSEIIVKIK